MSKETSKVKLTLTLPEGLNAELDQWAEESGVTKSDILRRALRLFEVAHAAKQRGESIGVITKDRQQVLTEIVGV